MCDCLATCPDGLCGRRIQAVNIPVTPYTRNGCVLASHRRFGFLTIK